MASLLWYVLGSGVNRSMLWGSEVWHLGASGFLIVLFLRHVFDPGDAIKMHKVSYGALGFGV